MNGAIYHVHLLEDSILQSIFNQVKLYPLHNPDKNQVRVFLEIDKLVLRLMQKHTNHSDSKR